MSQNRIKTSRFLSLVLRHRPETIGLELDQNGWASVAELVEKVNAHGSHSLTDAYLQEIVSDCDKQRFAFSEDRLRIRANQGHSVQIDLDLKRSPPPELLYHGTVERFLSSIRESGLISKERTHVHLSPNKGTATRVGQRRGEPIILEIRAQAMHAAGHSFYLSANGVWLTASIPPEFIDFP